MDGGGGGRVRVGCAGAVFAAAGGTGGMAWGLCFGWPGGWDGMLVVWFAAMMGCL